MSDQNTATEQPEVPAKRRVKSPKIHGSWGHRIADAMGHLMAIAGGVLALIGLAVALLTSGVVASTGWMAAVAGVGIAATYLWRWRNMEPRWRTFYRALLTSGAQHAVLLPGERMAVLLGDGALLVWLEEATGDVKVDQRGRLIAGNKPLGDITSHPAVRYARGVEKMSGIPCGAVLAVEGNSQPFEIPLRKGSMLVCAPAEIGGVSLATIAAEPNDGAGEELGELAERILSEGVAVEQRPRKERKKRR